MDTPKGEGKYLFAIPVNWMMSDVVYVHAGSMEEAQDYVRYEYELAGEYIEGSFEFNDDLFDEYPANKIAEDMIDIDAIPYSDLPLHISKKWQTDEGKEYFAKRFKK